MKLTPEQIQAIRSLPPNVGPNRLRVAFAMSGARQVDACEAIGLRANQVSSLVKGDYKSVSVDIARALADFFGCAIEDLFPAKSEVA